MRFIVCSKALMYHLFCTIILTLLNEIKVVVGIPLNIQRKELKKIMLNTEDYIGHAQHIPCFLLSFVLLTSI